jgi:dephospho-CoA kinase
MLWIGLTGGIGSGKSTFAKFAQEMGIPVIFADAVVRDLLTQSSEVKAEIEKRFGKQVFNDSQEIDRTKLGKLVFADQQSRQDLERIIHPRVRTQVQQVRRDFGRKGHKIAIYEVPLLFEQKMESQFDCIIFISAPMALRIRRLMNDRQLSLDEAQSRIVAQLPEADKVKMSTYVLNNSGDLESFSRQSKELLQKLKNQTNSG